MKRPIRSAQFTLSLLIVLGVAQAATALSDTAPADHHARLSAEEVVSRLVQRNLERARALGAYQGTRFIAWNITASRAPEARR